MPKISGGEKCGLVAALKDDDSPVGPDAKTALEAIVKALPETEHQASDVKSALDALAQRKVKGK